ncbi:exo-alpha-sialidase [Haloechinothrix sp. YIM 98757]|uniref:Exo-alpha-sialidase n=1 Tax=Haloechinothrix aidingensis TaxID=2752311 RepID=A0A838AEA4_9PSEU|nr:exo-alpha-sialidase [Haloechinothrix aidingensis]MBA0127654.1 exo-alpha-sialidase [Haloechinothrix aidingensis]
MIERYARRRAHAPLRWPWLGPAAAAVLLAGACQGDTDGGGEHTGHGGDGGHDTGSGGAEMAHIHGLGINPADDDLYVATHFGVFHLPEGEQPVRVAGHTQDVMGFTIVGPDHFLASGHPGADDPDQPPHLGLIESTDAAESWEPVSLHGDADFHALEAAHDQVYGFDGVSGRFMVSADQQEWEPRSDVPMADIAVSPEDPDLLVATTEQGPVRSEDGGNELTPISGAPQLLFLDWRDNGSLVGVDADATVHASTDGGDTWTEGDAVDGNPAALAVHGDEEVYVATDAAIYHSTDGGESFGVFHELG